MNTSLNFTIDEIKALNESVNTTKDEINATIKLAIGPASAVSAIPSLTLLKFLAFI